MLRGETFLPGYRNGKCEERRGGKESRVAVVGAVLMTSAGLSEPGACGASRPDWREDPVKHYCRTR